MKNQPTKKQLVDRLAHFETSVQNLVDSLKSTDDEANEEGVVDVDLVLADLQSILSRAPSITPQPKAVADEAAAAE